MLTMSNALQSLTARLAELRLAASRRVGGALDAFRAAAQRRRVLGCMRELRERDPRLFEETGFDSNYLPPPAADALSLSPQSVIGEYLFGNHR